METIPTSALAWGPVLAILGAFLAVFLGGLGSSMGIRTAGQKGAGVLAEKPDLFGSILVLTILPGSQGIYGLLVAIIILLQAGMLGGGEALNVTVGAGIAFLLAGLIMGISGLSSALLQAKVVASSIGAVAKESSISGKAIILSAMIETYAIFGMLIAIFVAIAANLA